jgi:NADP-dependent 3-hydroxy acid dehydrogenase YdfG
MLSGEGAKVALAARREVALREVQAGLAAGADSLVHATDVTDRGLVEALVERTETSSVRLTRSSTAPGSCTTR